MPTTAPTPNERVVALLEVILCSDYPTQLALEGTFAAFGLAPRGDSLSLGYVATLSLTDTLLLTGLIVLLLRSHGERPRELFLGNRPIGPEIRAGIPLLFVAFGIAVAVLLTTQLVAPWLHTVPRNPLEDLARTPGQAVLFAIVLIVAGGLREEIQRAFLLRRFELWLGGPRVGLVVTSIGFGAGHFIQGADAVVATAVLGAFWGVVYLRRRSIVAPAVSHSGFNVVQVLQFLALGH
jgi:membrane protease YdiL (CAAX protease family)